MMLRLAIVLAVLSGTALATEQVPTDYIPGVNSPSYAHSQYMLHCQGCHLPDGMGFPGRIPRLTGFMGNFLKIEGGREFLVQVPGSATAPIDDATLAQVLNWMLFTFSAEQLPKNYQPYTEEEISKLRQAPLKEVTKYRQHLLQKLASQ